MGEDFFEVNSGPMLAYMLPRYQKQGEKKKITVVQLQT